MKHWEDHEDHMMNHISWPATKQDIIDACEGEDVKEEVMKELSAIPDQEYESADDLKKVLVESE